ncbi:MAG: hypothetical protein CMH60_05055 [Myxococcales bacterium]|nr:hypothetical protein [Myxococcales bacterium]
MSDGIQRALSLFKENSKLLSLLDDKALDRLADSARVVSVSSGERIVEEGQSGDEFYLLVQGKVQVLVGRSHREIAYLEPGHFFGEIGAVIGETRSATIKAVSDVELIAIRGKALVELLDDHRSLKDVLTGVGLKRTEENLERILNSIDSEDSLG